jgi:uncharacterized protein with GYD domain
MYGEPDESSAGLPPVPGRSLGAGAAGAVLATTLKAFTKDEYRRVIAAIPV